MTIDLHNLDIDSNDQNWLQAEVNAMTLARMLKAHRLSEGWTQEQVAVTLGISKQAYSAYETGRKLPTPKTTYQMAEKLGMLPKMAVLAVINEQLMLDELPFSVELVS